jgi:alkylated DNA repair dioxygenase AlkB
MTKGISVYDPNFLASPEADWSLAELITLPWKRHVMKMHGKEVPMPRLYQWMGMAPRIYGENIDSIDWTPETREIQERVHTATGFLFNSLNINLYRNHNNHIGWHSDGEEEGSWEYPIAPVSLGAEPLFPDLPISRQWKTETQIPQTFWRAGYACRSGAWQFGGDDRRVAATLCAPLEESGQGSGGRCTNKSNIPHDEVNRKGLGRRPSLAVQSRPQ